VLCKRELAVEEKYAHSLEFTHMTISLDDILKKVRRLYSVLCYHHSGDDKPCVKCLSRKNGQNSMTQLWGKPISPILCYWWGEKRWWTGRAVEVRTWKSSTVFVS